MPSAFQIEELARQCAQDGISDVNTSLTQDYLKIWNAVRDDIIWHDVYFYGEEALYYYSGSLRETGILPRDIVPRWVFIAIAVREAISHGFGDFEFVEEAINKLRVASESLLWPDAIQEIKRATGVSVSLGGP